MVWGSCLPRKNNKHRTALIVSLPTQNLQWFPIAFKSPHFFGGFTLHSLRTKPPSMRYTAHHWFGGLDVSSLVLPLPSSSCAFRIPQPQEGLSSSPDKGVTICPLILKTTLRGRIISSTLWRKKLSLTWKYFGLHDTTLSVYSSLSLQKKMWLVYSQK